MSKQQPPKFVFHLEDNGNVVPMRLQQRNALTELSATVYELRSVSCGPGMERLELVPSTGNPAPKKVYGDLPALVNRYFRSYERLNRNMGVLLSGDKGSGKTTMLNVMIEKALQLGMPIIRINSALHPDQLRDVLSAIEQDVLVAFDEYDKTHSSSDSDETQKIQDAMLGIIEGSGMGAGKKLMVFVVNRKSVLSDYLVNRPGRVRYSKHFDGLPTDVLVAYARENMKDFTEEKLFDLVKLNQLIQPFNFDMMAAVVDETNHCGGTFYENTLMMFGDDAISRGQPVFAVKTLADGSTVDYSGNEYIGASGLEIFLRLPSKDREEESAYLRLDMTHFVKASPDFDTFEYEKEGEHYLVHASCNGRGHGVVDFRTGLNYSDRQRHEIRQRYAEANEQVSGMNSGHGSVLSTVRHAQRNLRISTQGMNPSSSQEY